MDAFHDLKSILKIAVLLWEIVFISCCFFLRQIGANRIDTITKLMGRNEQASIYNCQS